MKQLFVIFLSLSLSQLAKAQTVLYHVEDFETGDSMVFRIPDVESINLGEAGTARTWDFSKMQISLQKKTQHIIPVNWSSFGMQFPKANVVERTSDGTYVFMIKSGDTNHVTGFVDSAQNLVIKYSKPYTFIKRPFAYGDSIAENYARSYTVNGSNISGTGNSLTKADGYGTLILPNKTYNDVLRVRFEQNSYDVMATGDTQFVYTVSYAWFDAHHKSALLKIDSVSIVSRFFSDQFKEGIVLEGEFSTGIRSDIKPEADFDIYGTQDGNLWIDTKEAGQYKMEILGLDGKLIHTDVIRARASQKQVIKLSENISKKGIVLVRVSNEKSGKTTKVFNK